ncbi:MAG TPA: VOC family protein [Candidatus Eisenbacteria bacterium]|nr:VOC family protein [Candidatus Eisenbacteria bacterium]
MPRIRHLAIVTSNRERLVKFYTTAFGMRVIYGRATSTHLSDGDFNLAIVDQGADLKPGLYALGLDVNDVQELAGTLKSAGASSELMPMPKDHDAEYRVLDPDGNRLDLAIHGWCVV